MPAALQNDLVGSVDVDEARELPEAGAALRLELVENGLHGRLAEDHSTLKSGVEYSSDGRSSQSTSYLSSTSSTNSVNQFGATGDMTI